ncbi:hypothetical protein DEU56DRAFT_928467 [Suillus clintonianus]|uniref:uncharacterized protein n=1 Tax=Suillus clintonianus TaxID=1904413 RepID=UPI001B866A72|nr:uncharacterized protein DEU56DRAFT_928467 [Suillus clintonianus]KAG2120261.1 hypothetical protein DEU56DRAFT_928467 [Suillus clintonianus]
MYVLLPDTDRSQHCSERTRIAARFFSTPYVTLTLLTRRSQNTLAQSSDECPVTLPKYFGSQITAQTSTKTLVASIQHNAQSVPHSRMGYHPAPLAPPKPQSTQPSTRHFDPFYGHEPSPLCAQFKNHLFACPEYPPSSSNSQVKLPHFIAYALHRTKLHSSVTFAALVLLQRLKARFPTARGSSGHRLFISAFMLASKVICDDTYSNKSWSIVAQGMFQLREINQMEREMCQYLEWELNVDPVTLREFEEMVKKYFVGQGPYPTYILPSSSKTTPPPTTNPFPPPPTALAPTPSYGHRYPSPPKPTYPPPSTYITPPTTPDTPSPSYSTSTSPASTASPPTPPTPPGMEDCTARIVSASSSPSIQIEAYIVCGRAS